MLDVSPQGDNENTVLQISTLEELENTDQIIASPNTHVLVPLSLIQELLLNKKGCDKLNKSLQEQLELTVPILNGINNPIVYYDSDKKVRWLNSLASAWFNNRNVIGMAFNEIADSEERIKLFNTHFELARTTRKETGYQHQRGNIWVRTRFTPMFRQNTFIGIIGWAEDITEQKRLDTEQVDLKLQLQNVEIFMALQKQMDRHIHDLRNLLTSLLGNAELLIDYLQNEDTDNHELLDYSTSIHRSGLLIYEILKSLRSITRDQNPRFQETYIGNILESLSKTVRNHPKISGIPIILTGNPEVKAMEVLIDPELILRALSNLLFNAGDAIKAKYPIGQTNFERDSIEIVVLEEEENIKLEIHDTGIGMPQSILQKIFTESFTTKKEGSGVGLQVIKQVIKAHKGDISVRSELNHGSIFSIILPKSIKLSALQVTG